MITYSKNYFLIKGIGFIILFFILGCILIGVHGCADKKSVVKVQNNAVIYDGPINTSNADKLISILQATNIKTIYINSQGGSSEAGLKIGEFVAKNDISVIVVGACHSACANYVFLPSKDKKAIAIANIGMHGGYQSYRKQRLSLLEILPNDIKQLYRKSFESEEFNINQEIFLLKSANINPEIIEESAKKTLYAGAVLNTTIEGREKNYKVEKIKNSEYELWFPSAKDYKIWGIDIEIIESPKFLPSFLYQKFTISNH